MGCQLRGDFYGDNWSQNYRRASGEICWPRRECLKRKHLAKLLSWFFEWMGAPIIWSTQWRTKVEGSKRIRYPRSLILWRQTMVSQLRTCVYECWQFCARKKGVQCESRPVRCSLMEHAWDVSLLQKCVRLYPPGEVCAQEWNLKELTEGHHKNAWSMWLNLTQRGEPYRVRI